MLIEAPESMELAPTQSGPRGRKYPEFHELLTRQGGRPWGIDTNTIGTWLKTMKGKIHGGYRLEVKPSEGHGNRYYLTRLSEGAA